MLARGLFVKNVGRSCRSLSSIRPATRTRFSTAAVKKEDDDETPLKAPTPRTETTPCPVSFDDVSRAYYRILGGVKRSHCDHSQFLSDICGCNVYLKKDLEQFTGSFKERGARNSLLQLSPEERKKGVITASAGNHAQALAWHGKDLGIPVTCVMPVVAPITKVEKCRKFGANVVIEGQHIGEAKVWAQKNHPDMKYINGYDDPEIVAGAGTMGIEILEQVPNTDAVLVPVGGAGLIAGVSLAIRTLRPDVKVIGVEPENVASYAAAVKAGKPVDAYKGATLADGLAVPVVGPTAFEVARRFVQDTCAVTEKMIATAVLRLVECDKVVVEGGGAAGLAAILPGGPLYGKFKGQNVVIPLCGGNIDITTLGRVIERGLSADQRLVRFSAVVSDRPGGIAGLAKEMAELGASIKDILHERAWLYSRVDQVVVKCVVETVGAEHTEKIIRGLQSKGYQITRE